MNKNNDKKYEFVIKILKENCVQECLKLFDDLNVIYICYNPTPLQIPKLEINYGIVTIAIFIEDIKRVNEKLPMVNDFYFNGRKYNNVEYSIEEIYRLSFRGKVEVILKKMEDREWLEGDKKKQLDEEIVKLKNKIKNAFENRLGINLIELNHNSTKNLEDIVNSMCEYLKMKSI